MNTINGSMDSINNIKKVRCGRYSVDLTDKGRFTDFDDGFIKITGYTPEQLKSSVTFYDLIPPEDYDDYMQQIEIIKENGGGTLEHRLLCADGSRINIICMGDGFSPDENGRINASCTICDTSDKLKLLNENLRSKREIEKLMEIIPGGIALYKLEDSVPTIIKASEEYYSILGIPQNEEPLTIAYRLTKIDREAMIKKMIDCSKTRKPFRHDVKLNINGERRWASYNASPFESDFGGDALIYCTLVDITNEKENHRKLVKQSLCFNMISEYTEEIFFDYDAEKDTFSITTENNGSPDDNKSYKDFLKNHVGEMLLYPDDKEVYYHAWETALSEPCNGKVDYRRCNSNGQFKWLRMVYVSTSDEGNEVSNVYGMIYSIENVKSMKSKIDADRKEIERLSSTDPITGLYNRNAFKTLAAKKLKEIYNKDECFAIGYSDINDFSYVNENFGYEAGDQMLYDFAEVIRSCEITVVGCRIYSDYFVTLYKAQDRETLIEEIKNRNTKFSSIQKGKYPMSNIQISCGMYFIRSADDDITIAIDNANLARRSVKGTSDIPCGVYTERMRTKRSHEQAIASEVQSALARGQIELFLQPKFDLNSREIIGAEALSRWKNSDGSYKLPYEFIDVLENVGYITQVDLYIYEQALKCLARWKQEGKKLVPISVNFSRKHNNNPSFVNKVISLADFYKVDRSLIEIEVTESCFMQDVKNLFSNMRRLRDNGFKIDIDDFGTGYSSLSVLIDAPVDIVKVDKVFIDNIDVDERSRDYVNQICSLINSTQKEIIFEGVETEEQAQILSKSGHTMAQGWLFDKAISIDEFDQKYLKQTSTN